MESPLTSKHEDKKYGNASLSFRGSIIWNQLPDPCKAARTDHEFKMKIKSWKGLEFKLMCRSRDRLKKLAVSHKSDILMQAYRQMRNRVNKLNLNLKREFFANKIASYDGDLKTTWKTINQVPNRKSMTTHIASLEVEGKTVSGDTAIAESMNNFFCEIGKTLSDKIPQSSNPLLDNDCEVNPESVQFHF